MDWEIWTDEWVITDDNEEEEGDYYGMVHLEVVWEEVEVFLMSVTDTFLYEIYEKDEKK